MRLLFTWCFNMSASAENVQNLITYLPLSCNSSLLGLLRWQFLVAQWSFQLLLLMTEISNAEPLCRTGRPCCIDTVMSLSRECMKYLWGQGSATAACSQTGKAGCFSLPHSAGSIVPWALPCWECVERLCRQRLLPAGLQWWINPPLENTTARKGFL